MPRSNGVVHCFAPPTPPPLCPAIYDNPPNPTPPPPTHPPFIYYFSSPLVWSSPLNSTDQHSTSKQSLFAARFRLRPPLEGLIQKSHPCQHRRAAPSVSISARRRATVKPRPHHGFAGYQRDSLDSRFGRLEKGCQFSPALRQEEFSNRPTNPSISGPAEPAVTGPDLHPSHRRSRRLGDG